VKFRKKPVVIEAVQWTGENSEEVLSFALTGPRPLWGDDFGVDTNSGEVCISTPEGRMTADPDDWIIRGVEGEFYPCKESIFHKTYEAVKP